MFGGAFLDTFASASRLLEGLKEAGYDTEGRSPEELQEVFVTGGHCNLPQWCEEGEGGITWEFEGEEYPIRGICVGNVFWDCSPFATRREKAGIREDITTGTGSLPGNIRPFITGSVRDFRRMP